MKLCDSVVSHLFFTLAHWNKELRGFLVPKVQLIMDGLN